MVLNCPYEFKSNTTTNFTGIWNLNQYKVIGLTATAKNDLQQILEDVVTEPEPVHMLEFKSEYEFVTSKSLLEGSIVMLEPGTNILSKVIEECKAEY